MCPWRQPSKNAFAASGSSPTRSEAACNPPDILVENQGSIFLLRPVTCLGQSWLKENVIGEETQIFGNAIVCEPRYVIDIVLGARAEGVVGPMTNEKPISLGEDDLKLMKELGVAVDPEHHWVARMAGAIVQGKRCFVNPKTGRIKVSA